MSVAPRIDRLENNYVINGNMDFFQRGLSFTSMASNQVIADRFRYAKSASGGVHTGQRSTDVPNIKSNYSMDLTVTTAQASIGANDFFQFVHGIEGYTFQTLTGKQLTLSFWVKATKTGISCVRFANGNGDRSYIAEYTINATNTWEYKTITLQHDSSGTWNYTNGNGLRIFWSLAQGTNRQASPNVWLNDPSSLFLATSNQVNHMDANSNIFRISQVRVTVGPALDSASFERAGRSIGGELLLCQRYFEKSYHIDVAPGTNGEQNGVWTFGGNVTYPSSDFVGHIKFAVRKRSAPTTTFYGYAGGINRLSNANGGADQAANTATVLFNGEDGTNVYNSSGGSVAVQGVSLHFTADAEL